MEATLEAITFDELVGIQDMGAAGLTSSSSEMAAKGGGSGLVLHSDQVPTREPGISPYEMMLSETQERMLLVVEKEQNKSSWTYLINMNLIVQIGEVTDTDRFVLKYEDEVYADIPVDALADEAPVYILEGEEKEYNTSKMIIVRSMYKMYLRNY